MGNENADDFDKEFWIRELKQEKFLADELIQHLEDEKIISDEILGSLSHELRTPIVAIKGYTDMLLKNKFGKLLPEQKQKLEITQDNTDKLIQAILDMVNKNQKK